MGACRIPLRLMNDLAFSFERVELGYGRRKVLDISKMEIPKGKIIFIVGPSGIGKSTFLECAGLMTDGFIGKENEGSISISGMPYDPYRLWKENKQEIFELRNRLFSFIFQSTNLMSEFTVLENILLAAKYDSDDHHHMESRIRFLLGEMGLDEGILERLPHEISGGQKQRVAFIRALSGQFEILLADEPTGNLDMKNSHALFRILQDRLHTDGKTALIVTHHLELAKEYGDLIIAIDQKEGESFARPHMFEASGFNESFLN